MALPGVYITLGNGGLGQVAATADSVAGMIITGIAIENKLQLNKVYSLSSTKDLEGLGVNAENNPLTDKEVKAFYAQAGEGSELHILVVSPVTTLTAMCGSESGSPLCKLIDSTGGRIRLVGINKLPPSSYVTTTAQGIDEDAITAAAAAQLTAESYASKIKPFRILVACPDWQDDSNKLFQPSNSSYNRVGMVLASDQVIKTTEANEEGVKSTRDMYTAAIGMVLGRAAKMEPHQNLGRVKSGSLAAKGYFTNGKTFTDAAGKAELLNDAGYIFFIGYPSMNGCYLNGNPMAAKPTDDYAELNNGRIIDKAMGIVYNTYITEIMDNISVDDKGNLNTGVCKNFEGMISNAINALMGSQISSFEAYINPAQNILSTGVLEIGCTIVPQGVLKRINITLGFANPALS